MVSRVLGAVWGLRFRLRNSVHLRAFETQLKKDCNAFFAGGGRGVIFSPKKLCIAMQTLAVVLFFCDAIEKNKQRRGGSSKKVKIPTKKAMTGIY